MSIHPAACALNVLDSGPRWVDVMRGGEPVRDEVTWQAPTPTGPWFFIGQPGRWRQRPAQVKPRPCPDGLRLDVGALEPAGSLTIQRIECRGLFVIDPAGQLLEVGVVDGKVLVSFAGWPLLAMTRLTVEVSVDPALPGLLFVGPQAALRGPLRARMACPHYERTRQEGIDLLADHGLSFPDLTPTPTTGRRRPVIPQVEVLHKAEVPISHLVWLDGAVRYEHWSPEALPCAEAAGVFEPLKEQLAAQVGQPVQLEGLFKGEVLLSGEARAPEGLRGLFRWAERQDTLAHLRIASRPTRISEVIDKLGHDSIEELIDDEDLVSADRREALRFLFGCRDPERPAWLWQDNALLIPLRTGSGQALLAWEHLEDNHATYLFAAGHEAAVLDLVSARTWRRLVRQDPVTAEQTGFVGRIEHRGGDEAWLDKAQQLLA